MKLGILVNTAANRDAVAGITEAAAAQGHEIIIFVMDEGTRLLENSGFTELHAIPGVEISYCEHSALELGINTQSVPQKISAGSQYNNATMNNQADKVIVL